MLSIRRTITLVRKVFTGFSDNELFTRSAAIAFYAAFSFAPMLVLVLWAISTVRAGLDQQLVQAMAAFIGDEGAAAARMIVDSARSRPQLGHVLGLVSLGITLFSASAVFAQMQGTLDRIWHVKPEPGRAVTGWLLARARAIGVLLGATFLAIVSFALTTLIGLLVPSGSLGWLLLENALALSLLVLAFGAMYRVLPDAHIAWRDALRGGLMTTLLFMGGKFLIALYIEHSRIGGAYGPASALVLFMMWMYYASLIVLIGAELTHGLARVRGQADAPERHARSTA